MTFNGEKWTGRSSKNAFIRTRDRKPIKPKSWSQFWRELLCPHYWIARVGNPDSLLTFPATCGNCGKRKCVAGIMLDEIEVIVV